MSNLDRHLLLCDLVPGEDARAADWKRAIGGVKRIILEHQHPSPWEVADILAKISVHGRLGSDPFSASATGVLSRALPDSSGCNALFGSVCVMSAAIRVLASRQLNVKRKVLRRNSIALALWSALSFQKPLAAQRLEDVRAELLHSARCAGLNLARESRLRRTPPNGASPNVQIRSLQWNTVLHREEIKVLRWTLADESSLLDRPYAEFRRDESVALARGLELGLLLTKFPGFEHYELACRDVAPGHEIDLSGLLDALGEDRNALAAPFNGNAIIDTYAAVFPLLTALRNGQTRHVDGAVRRSLADWCGRALLESAIVRHSQMTEGS